MTSMAANARVAMFPFIIWLPSLCFHHVSISIHLPRGQACLTAAVECGYSTLLFSTVERGRAEQWQKLASFKALLAEEDGTIKACDGSESVGMIVEVGSKEELRFAELAAAKTKCLVMDATDWKVGGGLLSRHQEYLLVPWIYGTRNW